MSDHKPNNYVALTVAIKDVTESKKGAATIADAALSTRSGEMPVRVVATNGVRKWLKAGQAVTLHGRIAYEERSGEGVYVLYPDRAEKVKKDQPRNFAKLTVRLGADPEARYTEAGQYWARLRAFVGQGKDKEGEYKPSLWLTVKGFATREGDESLPAFLAACSKGDLITVSGPFDFEVYNDKGYLSLAARKAEGFSFEAVEEPEALAGEPA